MVLRTLRREGQTAYALTTRRRFGQLVRLNAITADLLSPVRGHKKTPSLKLAILPEHATRVKRNTTFLREPQTRAAPDRPDRSWGPGFARKAPRARERRGEPPPATPRHGPLPAPAVTLVPNGGLSRITPLPSGRPCRRSQWRARGQVRPPLQETMRKRARIRAHVFTELTCVLVRRPWSEQAGKP